jgi:LacI family transcriptional regulator
VALAEDLLRMVRSEGLKSGSRLPSERELARAFRVALLTIRQALHLLEQRGLIVRHHGRGTFVADPCRRRLEMRQRLPSIPPVRLVGLGPELDAEHEPVNWEPLLYRYRGIMEAGARFGLTITSPDLAPEARGVAWWMSELKGSLGVLVEGDRLGDEVIAELLRRGTPVVAVNRHAAAPCSRVVADTRQGARLAIEHLVSLGHRRIGLVVGDQARPLMRLRHEGCLEALAAAGIPLDERLLAVDRRGLREDGADAARSLLRQGDPPTAIFAASDTRALGVIDALVGAGLRVPRDVSVVGFDDLKAAGRMRPPLTTVRNPLYESGFEAVRLLWEHAGGQGMGIRVVTLPMSLVVRESTAAPARPRAPPAGGARNPETTLDLPTTQGKRTP